MNVKKNLKGMMRSLAFTAVLTVQAATGLAQAQSQTEPQSAASDTLRVWQRTQTRVHLGAAFPSLNGGKELERSKALRDAGLSYYENAAGVRKAVGSYGNPGGFTLGISFYKPVWTDGLMLGASVSTSLTGTQPSTGGYAEGYFFNYLLAGVSAKYYPVRTTNFFLTADAGLSSVFTKNRFVGNAGEQNFFHQFGIGTAVAVGAGYTVAPFGNQSPAFDVGLSYQLHQTRVEVDGIGDDSWSFGSLNLTVSLVLL